MMEHQRRAERSFEGRPLPRPEEELVDQGLGFDLGTVFSRRRMLQALGLGVTGIGLAACGAGDPPASAGPSASSSPSGLQATDGTSTVVSEIPEETAGPFPGDGSNGPDALARSGIVRSDIRTSLGGAGGTAEGVPMTLELTIQDLANGGVPFAGTAVYVWHCDRDGAYSMYSAGATEEDYLRGVQIADASGRVRFTSIFPACYPGRWPHVHFEVYPDQNAITDSANVIATSQVALPEDVCRTVYAQPGYAQSQQTISGLTLATDSVFRDDAGAKQLGTATGDVSSGYAVSLVVGVDTRTR